MSAVTASSHELLFIVHRYCVEVGNEIDLDIPMDVMSIIQRYYLSNHLLRVVIVDQRGGDCLYDYIWPNAKYLWIHGKADDLEMRSELISLITSFFCIARSLSSVTKNGLVFKASFQSPNQTNTRKTISPCNTAYSPTFGVLSRPNQTSSNVSFTAFGQYEIECAIHSIDIRKRRKVTCCLFYGTSCPSKLAKHFAHKLLAKFCEVIDLNEYIHSREKESISDEDTDEFESDASEVVHVRQRKYRDPMFMSFHNHQSKLYKQLFFSTNHDLESDLSV
eukprot:557362_1